jgi:hypothetical protein
MAQLMASARPEPAAVLAAIRRSIKAELEPWMNCSALRSKTNVFFSTTSSARLPNTSKGAIIPQNSKQPCRIDDDCWDLLEDNSKRFISYMLPLLFAQQAFPNPEVFGNSIDLLPVGIHLMPVIAGPEWMEKLLMATTEERHPAA